LERGVLANKGIEMFTRSRFNLREVLEHTRYGKVYIDAIAWFPVKGYLYTLILPDGTYKSAYEPKLLKEISGYAFVNGIEQRNTPINKPLDDGFSFDPGLNTMFYSSMPAKPKKRPFRTLHDVVWVDFKNKKRA
jgi:hypothetical protein